MSFKNANTIDKQVSESVTKAVAQAVNQGVTQAYVEELKDRVVNRTRLGIGVNPINGKGYKLPPLSEGYKTARKGTKIAKQNKFDAKRKRNAKKKELPPPKLTSTTTPSKSNLTATGQLLRSLTVAKARITGGVAFFINVGDNRGKDLFGRSSKIGNKTLVGYLAQQGRVFLGFTNSQKNQITKEIRQIILKFLD